MHLGRCVFLREQVLLGNEDAQFRSLPGVMDYGAGQLGCFWLPSEQ